MPFYYVTHPSLGFTAVIDAPSTEKARTTYLDYLERQGRVPRSERQHLRRNMVASRILDPGEVTVDINLAYGYEEVSFATEEPKYGSTPIQYEPTSEGPPEPNIGQMEMEEAEHYDKQVEEPQVFSPIQLISLGRNR